MRKIEYNNGFTLIELLVAIAAVGVLATVSVNLLYSTVLSRSRQNSIATSSNDIRGFISGLTKDIKEANLVDVKSATEIRFEVLDDLCKAYYLDDKSIKLAVNEISGCAPPDPDPGTDKSVTSPSTEVAVLEFSPVSSDPESVNVKISGQSKDSFGTHDFSFETAVVPRT